MDATVAVSCDSLAEDDLQSLTRELSTTINRETDVSAAIPEAPAEPGSRGDPAILHTLLLTFMTSGAAVAMFQVIKSYVERNKSLTMTFKRSDGEELVIDQTNMSADQMDKTVEFARAFFDKP